MHSNGKKKKKSIRQCSDGRKWEKGEENLTVNDHTRDVILDIEIRK